MIAKLKFSLLLQINIGSFEIQLMDLKNKEVWYSKFECLSETVEKRRKCNPISQHKWSALNDLEKEDMSSSNTLNSIPESYDQLK